MLSMAPGFSIFRRQELHHLTGETPPRPPRSWGRVQRDGNVALSNSGEAVNLGAVWQAVAKRLRVSQLPAVFARIFQSRM